MNKKGISPVIATVLLIAIALTLAVIIFIWARSFVSESITKNGQAITFVCDDVKDTFDAEAKSDGELLIVNRGNVPLYGFEVSKVTLGARTRIGEGTFVQPVSPGDSGSISLGTNSLSSGDKISVVPIVLGEQQDTKLAYTCGESYSVESIVV